MVENSFCSTVSDTVAAVNYKENDQKYNNVNRHKISEMTKDQILKSDGQESLKIGNEYVRNRREI